MPLCRSCSAEASPLHACLAAVAYEGAAERWIRRFKYPASGLAGLDPAPRAVVAELARDAARRAPGPPADCIIPIPLHSRRARTRGFNPAALLAHEIGRASALPVHHGWLRRKRDTPSQTGLGRSERQRNMAGAFECTAAHDAAGERMPEQVWLVDDVVTTGATLREAAHCLRRKGVSRVVGLCAARTPLRLETRLEG
jgi:ComF family protein